MGGAGVIIYATKQTIDRYGIAMPEDFHDPVMRQIAMDVCDREKGDRFLEWGAKLFYFDHRKCIQMCHFASKLTVVLADIKKADLEYVGNITANYLLDIYSGNKRVTSLLERLFKEHPLVCFSRLTDRSIISTLNRCQTYFLLDGQRLYDYLKDGILHTKELNNFINKEYLITQKINGKTEYYYPNEVFEKQIKDYYK